MGYIIDFYKGLDTLNLIIFWGIIIVIVLLLIFSFILINKNKKLSRLVNKQLNEETLPIMEEVPIKKEEIIIPKTESVPKVNIPLKENILVREKEIERISKPIEPEKKFIAEEHVMGYNKDLFSLSNIKKTSEISEEPTTSQTLKRESQPIPTAPYQRNVLREMSLSQTSPIGLTYPNHSQDKQMGLAKDLQESLKEEPKENYGLKNNYNQTASYNQTREIDLMERNEIREIKEISKDKEESRKEIVQNKINNDNYQVRKELSNSDLSLRKNEIKEDKQELQDRPQPIIDNNINFHQEKLTTRELLNMEHQRIARKENKSNSEKYLEEVSKKLAESNIPDEVERTNYELKQEEDAIISYKELMEKKDSIQTIDEEEAVISIEELMNHHNKKQEEIKSSIEENMEDRLSNSKLYNLSDKEENDDFIKELKQFRSDL